jgi:hypothetical protein
MLYAYADETGSAPDPTRTHLGMGGLVANSEKWSAFDAAWRHICKEEGVDLPFHMKEFSASRKQFENPRWTEKERRNRLMDRLITAIDDTGAIPVGAIVNVPDFNSLSEGQQKSLSGEKREPYYVVFQECTRQLGLESALHAFPPELVSMVYAKLEKFTGEAEQLWSAIHDARLSMDRY